MADTQPEALDAMAPEQITERQDDNAFKAFMSEPLGSEWSASCRRATLAAAENRDQMRRMIYRSVYMEGPG